MNIFFPLSWLAKEQRVINTDSTEMNTQKDGGIAMEQQCGSATVSTGVGHNTILCRSLLHYYI